GDGNDDIALGNTDSVLLFAGGPEPIFGLLGDVPSPMFQEFGSAVDVDQDGRLDFISASQQEPGTTVALGHGGGTFGDDLGTPFLLPYQPADVQMADLDGDQQLDAVIRGSLELRTYLTGSFGVIVPGATVTLPRSASAFTLRDMNGDGALDLVTLLTSPGAI